MNGYLIQHRRLYYVRLQIPADVRYLLGQSVVVNRWGPIAAARPKSVRRLSSMAQSFDLLRRKPPGFAVLTGEDADFHPILTPGAEGGIVASAHVETRAFAAVRELLHTGDGPGALTA